MKKITASKKHAGALMTSEHREKYANFLCMIEDAKATKFEVVIVAYPSVLGDNYEELIINLGLLASAKLKLLIADAES